MKKILITGVHGFIGNQLKRHLDQSQNSYKIDMIGLRDGEWENKDFSRYDVVVHLAGKAHVSTNEKYREEYYRINTELTLKVAEKAKKEGVCHFIFLSSIIIFGSKNNNSIIRENTTPKPDSFYGDSKLQAEKKLKHLESSEFTISIIRPPMVYGAGVAGNYRRISRLAKKIPIFPNVNNKRSMIYVTNLCEFIRLIIDSNDGGYFHPQNEEYVATSELVFTIAKVQGKKILKINLLNLFLKILSKKVGIFNKMFGDLAYDKSMSEYKINYNIVCFEESIRQTESRDTY